ncbi:MAG: phosphomannomutase/phosphoglucomutase [Acidobacteria bacterium]|nr:phosphomannomutase/phosphoglucomutase [Acidobacteriota bacterium]
MLNEQIFREYDIRGKVDNDLTEEVVYDIGRAYASMVKKEGITKFVIGGDCRLSTPKLIEAAKDGFNSAGGSVIDIGIVPTPALYYALHNLDVGGGFMITGSHNPPEYNGIKIAKGKKTIFGKQIREVYEFIKAGKFEKGTGQSRKETIIERYIDTIIKKIKLDKSIKVIVDAGNGTAGPVAPVIFNELGAVVKEMFTEMDGHFPNHHPDPTVPENLEASIEVINKEEWDLITAFDGDADRLGAVDNKGRIIWGDMLLALFAREILEKNPGAAIIGEVKCSKVLYDDIKAHGGKAIMWKTGHSLIKEKMKEEKALLAGEMSGHLFFADDYYGYDDAIYAASRLLQLLSRTELSLADLLATLPEMFSTPEIRIDTTEENKWAVTEGVKKYFDARYDTIDIDGVRINFDDGWGLVRPSNTTPVIVMRFEASSPEKLESIKKEVTDKVNELL